jgi:hypothetical protein
LGALIATAASLLFPEPWQARYVPLVWAIPLLLLASVDHVIRQSRAMTILFGAVLLLAAANTGLAFAGNGVRTLVENREFYNLIWSLQAESTPLVIVPATFDNDFDLTLKHRLENHGFPAEIREGYACKNVLYVYHYFAKVCR